MKKKKIVGFVAFGSNLGNQKKTIESAIIKLRNSPHVRVLKVSSLYISEPVGPRQPDFFNGVLKVGTTLSPLKFLRLLRRIERSHGRRRDFKWGPRTLDLDILTWDRSCRRGSRLTIPHPRYHERRFVLVPFCELAPNFRHPLLRKTNRQLLRRLTVLGQRVTMIRSWKNSQFLRLPRRKKTKNPS